MEYRWTELGLRSIYETQSVETFGSPALNTIVTEEQLQQWKKVMSHESLTLEVLVKCGLCKSVAKPVSKPKPKTKKVYKKVAKKPARKSAPKPLPKIFKWSELGIDVLSQYGTTELFGNPTIGSEFRECDLLKWREIVNDLNVTQESLVEHNMLSN
jgi:hypothetical protein